MPCGAAFTSSFLLTAKSWLDNALGSTDRAWLKKAFRGFLDWSMDCLGLQTTIVVNEGLRPLSCLKPTLSDLTAAAVYQQHVAASELSSEEKRAAESRATGLAVLINREVDKLLARERGG